MAGINFIDHIAVLKSEYDALQAENAALRAEVERLRELLKECADEAEGWIEDYYKDTKDYPSEMRRYERDIDPIRRARTAMEQDT